MSANELREKSVEALQEELLNLRQEQFNLRMQNGTGESVKHHLHKRVRRDIARLKTVMNEKRRES